MQSSASPIRSPWLPLFIFAKSCRIAALERMIVRSRETKAAGRPRLSRKEGCTALLDARQVTHIPKAYRLPFSATVCPHWEQICSLIANTPL